MQSIHSKQSPVMNRCLKCGFPFCGPACKNCYDDCPKCDEQKSASSQLCKDCLHKDRHIVRVEECGDQLSKKRALESDKEDDVSLKKVKTVNFNKKTYKTPPYRIHLSTPETPTKRRDNVHQVTHSHDFTPRSFKRSIL
jgi:hypothetical protein